MGISSSGSNPFINPSHKIPGDQTHHELKTGKWSEDKDLGANNEPLVESHSDGSITLNASSSKSALSFEELKDLRPGDTIHFTYSVTPAPIEEAPVFAFLKYNDGDQSDSTTLDAKGEVTLKVPEDYNSNRPLMIGLHSPKNTSNQAYTISNTLFTSSSPVSSNQTEKRVSSILNSDQPAVLSSLKAIDSEVSQIKGLISNFASINQKYESSLESFKKTGSDSDKKKSDKAFEQLKGSHEEIRQRTGNLINVVSSNITPDIAKQAIGSTDPSFEGKVSEITDIWHNVASHYATQLSTEEKASRVPDSLPVKSSTLKDSSPISQWVQTIEGNAGIMNQLSAFSKAKTNISDLMAALNAYEQANNQYESNPTQATYQAAQSAWNTFSIGLINAKAAVADFSQDLQNELNQVITPNALATVLGQTITPTQASQIQAQMFQDLTGQLNSFENTQGYNPSTFPTTGPTPYTPDSPISQWAQTIEGNAGIMNQLSAFSNAKTDVSALMGALNAYEQANNEYESNPTQETYQAAQSAWNTFSIGLINAKAAVADFSTNLQTQLSQIVTAAAAGGILGQSITSAQVSQIQAQMLTDLTGQLSSFETTKGYNPSTFPTTGPTPYTAPISQWAKQIEGNTGIMNQLTVFSKTEGDISQLMQDLASYTSLNSAYNANPSQAGYNSALAAWNTFQSDLKTVQADISGFPANMQAQLAQVITASAAGGILGQSITSAQASQIQAQMLTDLTGQLSSFETDQGYNPCTFPTTSPTPYTPGPSGQIAEWANKLENNSAVMFKMLPFLNIKADIYSLMSALNSYTTAYNNYKLNKTPDNFNKAQNTWNVFSTMLLQTNNDLALFSTQMTNQLASVITPSTAENYLGQSITSDQAVQIQAQMLQDFTAQLTSFENSQGYDPSTFPTSGPQP